MIFVKSIVRRGLLGRMLTELLDTRVMVKQAMKSAKDDKVRNWTIHITVVLFKPTFRRCTEYWRQGSYHSSSSRMSHTVTQAQRTLAACLQ